MSTDVTTDEVSIDPNQATISELEADLESTELTAAELADIAALEEAGKNRTGALEAIEATEPVAETPDEQSDAGETARVFTLQGGEYRVNCPNCSTPNPIPTDTAPCVGCGAEFEIDAVPAGDA
ncbi:hypothetical protein [Halosegnis longus]|uniref:hypothetical protein n=1 Tax=Halosegnis longus TaxID=2216012 RepID=UPI00129DEAE3|nr:hypothetical protein [Halosegnis longus]